MVPPASGIDDIRRNANLIWLMLATMALVLVASFACAGLRVDAFSNPPLLAAVVAYGAVAWFYRAIRPDQKLYRALEAAGQTILALLLGLLLTYAAACSQFPYRDDALAALDQMAGIDRRAYFAFIADHPWLQTASGLVYLTIQPQIALVPFALIVTNQLRRLQCFTLAFAIALLITVGIAVLLPATAAHVFDDLRASQFTVAGSHVPTYEALRDGTLRTVVLNNFEGLITFPSFHAAAGLLFSWALWTVRYLRWPVLCVNAAMVAAAPIHGPHYVIDLPAGLAVAMMAIVTARGLCERRRSANPAATASIPSPQANQA
jgi:hypothetical protein